MRMARRLLRCRSRLIDAAPRANARPHPIRTVCQDVTPNSAQVTRQIDHPATTGAPPRTLLGRKARGRVVAALQRHAAPAPRDRVDRRPTRPSQLRHLALRQLSFGQQHPNLLLASFRQHTKCSVKIVLWMKNSVQRTPRSARRSGQAANDLPSSKTPIRAGLTHQICPLPMDHTPSP